MPFFLRISRCPKGHEFTIYVNPTSDDEVSITWICEECSPAGQAAEKPEASELRDNEAVGSGRDEPGHLVCAEEKTQGHHVYELVEHGTGQIFYIGVTSNPKSRYYEHGAPNSTSAALPRIQEIKQNGGEYLLLVVATFYDRGRAEAYEALLINELDGLVNRVKPPVRPVYG